MQHHEAHVSRVQRRPQRRVARCRAFARGCTSLLEPGATPPWIETKASRATRRRSAEAFNRLNPNPSWEFGAISGDNQKHPHTHTGPRHKDSLHGDITPNGSEYVALPQVTPGQVGIVNGTVGCSNAVSSRQRDMHLDEKRCFQSGKSTGVSDEG